MNFAKFTFYTFVGCVSWVLALTYLGYYLGENWDEVETSYTTWTTRSPWPCSRGRLSVPAQTLSIFERVIPTQTSTYVDPSCG